MIKLDLLKPFGKSSDGAVDISEGFSVDTGIFGYTECITVSLLSSYSGKSAPKIKFSLTVMGEDKPLYTSHSYGVL